MQNITIIWWTDWFWKWLANFILQNFREKISLKITWRNLEKWKKAAEELWCDFSDDNLDSVKNADIVIFAVPIAFMEKTIEQVAPNIKKWSVVVDICSIKIWPSLALKKFSPEWVLVIPAHPMFWPYVSTIAWQIFVLTPENEVKKDFRYKFLKNFLEKSWAKVIEETAENHDKMMAVVQWLTHFDMFVFWDVVKKLWFDIEKSMDFVSPIYKIMISSVARYVWQNPKLYWDIQMFNSKVLEIHDVFMESTKEFNEIVKNKDENSFIQKIQKTKKFFWKNTDKWQKYTDKIIYLIWKQIEKLEQNRWKKIFLKNIYSWEKIFWVLKNFSDHEIFFESWEKICLDEWEVL